MKIVYFGTPQFAADVLSYLLEHGVEVAAVITKPDKAQGRSSTLVPTPVKLVAQLHDLPVFQPEIVSDLAFAPTLEHYGADLFVVVAYGEIIKQHLLDMPKTACINLHGSLLPKYRGAAPIQRSIINGEKETGITIIHMVKKMDAGDMIAKVIVPITPNMTYGELEKELCAEGAKLLLQSIRDFESGPVSAEVQDIDLVTFAAKIELEDCKIDWTKSAQEIHNQVRGVTPHPGAWTIIHIKGQPKRLKVVTTRVAEQEGTYQAGKILKVTKEGMEVGCGEGILRLVEVQLEGKKAMGAADFARGYPLPEMHF